MQQAESDFRAAQRVDNEQDARSRCQAISKYQQCVEKSVKAVLDKLHSANVIRNGTDRKHPVARYALVLTRIPMTNDSRHLLNQMQRIFSGAIIGQINFWTLWFQSILQKASWPGEIMSTLTSRLREIGMHRLTRTHSRQAK